MISLKDMTLDNIGLVGLNDVAMQSLESIAGVVAGGSGYVAPVVEENTSGGRSSGGTSGGDAIEEEPSEENTSGGSSSGGTSGGE